MSKPKSPMLQVGSPFSQGLIGAWLMHGGLIGGTAGPVIHDFSGQKAHGTWVNGEQSWSRSYDGPRPEFAGSPTHNVINCGNYRASTVRAVTVAALVNSYSTDNLLTAVSKWNNTDRVFMLGHGSASSMYRFGIYIGDTFRFAESTNGFSTLTDNFIVGTFNGNVIKLFVNGDLVASTVIAGVIDPDPAAVVIGGRESLTQSWYGQIGYAMIWNYALDDNAINYLWQNPFAMFKRQQYFLIPTLGVSGSLKAAFGTGIAEKVTAASPQVGTLNVAAASTVAKIVTPFSNQTDVVFALERTDDILSAGTEAEGAFIALECGEFNLHKRNLPKSIWHDFRCDKVFKSVGDCDYGRDEFKGTSKTDIGLGGDGDKKVQGWFALNFGLDGVSGNINISDPDYLAIILKASNTFSWTPSVKNAPFLYRKYDLSNQIDLDRDFTCDVFVNGNGNEETEGEGLLITLDNDNPSAWVYFRREFYDGSNHMVVSECLDGLTENYVYTQRASHQVIRIVKEGITFKFYHKAEEDDPWPTVEAASTTILPLDLVPIRVGLCAKTDSASRNNDFKAGFDYIHFSGGYKICERLLTSCRLRGNTRRFGGAPGILHGALSL